MTETALLTTDQAAKRIGVSRATVVRMASDGRLTAAMKVPGYRGSLLFSREAVEERRQIELDKQTARFASEPEPSEAS